MSALIFRPSSDAEEVTYELTREHTVLGRIQAVDLHLSYATVGQRHALIRRTEAGAFVIEDLGTRNGVLLNGARVSVSEPAQLTDEDVIHLGEARLTFRA